MNLPENAYERNLNPTEVKELLADGWQQSTLHSCQDCFSSGCEKCFYTGVVATYNKEGKYYFGSPMFASDDIVGARCSVNHYGRNDQRVHFSARGCGGSAELVFTIPQMFTLLKMFANITGTPGENHQEEFGVEAKFRGPASMFLASMIKDGVTVAVIPDENKQKAIKLLEEAGLRNEARLFKSACEHEVFRGDESKEKEAREKVGEIKSGTII